MRVINYKDKDFAYSRFTTHYLSGHVPENIRTIVREIFDNILNNGDKALFKYTEDFESHAIDNKNIKVSPKEIKSAIALVPPADIKVLKKAVQRIKAYHKKQLAKGFVFDDGQGTVIEERILPLERVGLCIPGGRAPLASTVLMTAIPARLAGVKELVMINPWPKGRMNPHVLAAAFIVGVDEIYKIGGAQGVAALAGGTKSVPGVNKIVGPGSVWVTEAKAIAVSSGLCDIDSLAGPSEIAIVADKTANPEWIAIDLLSQAEHGIDSISTLVTTSKSLLKKVDKELEILVKESGDDNLDLAEAMEKIRAVIVRDLNMAAKVVDRLAPEHLEVMVGAPSRFAKKITNAASIFIGPYSPVPAGDYMAGGNHVLPTGGTARFSSPLGVHDFVKRQSITRLSREALKSISKPSARFAEIEGLSAHARAIKKRFSQQDY